MDAANAFNPFDRSWWADPYPTYRFLLEQAPAGRLNGLPLCYVARHADCEAALRHPRLGCDDRASVVYQSLAAAGSPPEEVAPRSLLRLDPPDHTRLRSLVSRAFTARAVAELSALIASSVEELVGSLGEGPFDAVAALGYPLPVRVISELLGVPGEERGRLSQLSRQLAGALDPELTVSAGERERRRGAIRELRAMVAALIDPHRPGPAGSLVGELVAATRDGAEPAKAGEGEIVSLLVLLLVAGYETTANLIGNCLLALARRPELGAGIAGDRARIASFVEEVLRLDPPVQLTSRIANDDVRIGELSVPCGHFLLVLLAAANRDPDRFERPEELDLGRGQGRHLSFSAGVHHCLGALLARAEALAVVESVLERWPRLELVDAPRYRETLVLRGLDGLVLAPA